MYKGRGSFKKKCFSNLDLAYNLAIEKRRSACSTKICPTLFMHQHFISQSYHNQKKSTSPPTISSYQVSVLKQNQVEFESTKHESKRLQGDLEDYHMQLDELESLKGIVERKLEEALGSLAQEREMKVGGRAGGGRSCFFHLSVKSSISRCYLEFKL